MDAHNETSLRQVNRLDRGTRQCIIDGLRSGIRVHALARKYRVAHSTIYRIARAHGVKTTRQLVMRRQDDSSIARVHILKSIRSGRTACGRSRARYHALLTTCDVAAITCEACLRILGPEWRHGAPVVGTARRAA